jgi:hypothetical protein
VQAGSSRMLKIAKSALLPNVLFLVIDEQTLDIEINSEPEN